MSEEKVEGAPSIEAMKRPTGLTIIVILWFLGGIYNLYMSSQNISNDLEMLPYLSDPWVAEWFKSGVPTDLVINLLVFALGLIQLFTIIGLWTRKSWSYKLALAIPVLAIVSWISIAGLYMPAPIEIRESINWAPIGFSIFWAIIWAILYWSYLRKPHVKGYLRVSIQKTLTEEVPEIPEVPKRPRKILIAILLIAIVAVASVSVFIWWYTQKAPEGEEVPTEYKTYSKYGFSIEYPKDMTITEEGVIDATANDDSGVVAGKSLGPYKSFAVSWAKSSTPLTRGDLENSLEEISNTPGFEKTGSIVETTKSGHEMIYQRYTYTEDGQKTYCIFGVWYCNIDKKLYCLGYEQTTEQDVLQIFEQYLDSFICH